MVRASTLPWSKRTTFATVQRRSTMLCGTGTMQSKIGTLSRRCVLIHNMGNWILILCLLTFSSCLPFFLHSVPSPCHFFCCWHTCHLPLPLPFPAVHPPSSGAAICHLCHLPCCEGSPVTIVSALGPHLWQGPSWSSIACRHLLEIVNTHLNAWTDTHKTVLSTSRPRVFNPVQAHVAESVQFASVATITCSQSVTTQISRTAHQVLPKKCLWNLSQQAPFCYALTGKSQGAAGPPLTLSGTYVQAAEGPIMELMDAIEQRRHNPSLHTTKRHGQSRCQVLACRRNTPFSSKASCRVLILGFHLSGIFTHHPISPPLLPS